jgi:hypothetical protein
MESIVKKMLITIALIGALLLVIVPSMNVNFAPNPQPTILADMIQNISVSFSPTTIYLLATGLVCLVLFDIKRTSSPGKRR